MAATQVEVDGLIRARRSTRQFAPRPVAEEDVRDLLRLAQWAPSPHNSQPWRFTILRANARRCLAAAMANQLASELRAVGVAESDVLRRTERSRTRISNAPGAVLCSVVHDGLVLTGDSPHDSLEFQMAVQSVGAALQTIFLAAWDRGVGACWMAAPMYCPDVVRDVLDLPIDFEPQALVLLGYPQGVIRPRDRLDVESVVDIR